MRESSDQNRARSPQKGVKFATKGHHGYASTSRTKPSELGSLRQIQKQASPQRAEDAFDKVQVVVGKRISMSPRSSKTGSTRK